MRRAPQPGRSRHRSVVAWTCTGRPCPGRTLGRGSSIALARRPSSASRRPFPRRPTPSSACWPTGRASTPGRCAGCSTGRSASGPLVTPWIGIASSCVPGITGSHGQLAIALDALRSQYAAAVPDGVVDALENFTLDPVGPGPLDAAVPPAPSRSALAVPPQRVEPGTSGALSRGEVGSFADFVAARIQAQDLADLVGRIRRHEAPWV